MYSSEEGDIVLDPFLGSGQVAVVSKMLGRKYIGFEIVKEYYEFAKERLEKGKYKIKCGSFQEDFRNADGSPRRAKVLLNLEEIDEELEYFIEF